MKSCTLTNNALAGQPTGGASHSDINAAVDAINRGTDGCRFLVSCPTVKFFESPGDGRKGLNAYLPTESEFFTNPLDLIGLISNTRPPSGQGEGELMGSEAEPRERFLRWLQLQHRNWRR